MCFHHRRRRSKLGRCCITNDYVSDILMDIQCSDELWETRTRMLNVQQYNEVGKTKDVIVIGGYQDQLRHTNVNFQIDDDYPQNN